MSAPGRYRKLYPRIWRHPGFRVLKPSARELALYLLTGPQSNGIGLFHFSPSSAADDLGVTPETIRKGLADIAATFGWLFDDEARVFYIPSWWRWNPPENTNVLKGNLKALSEIAPSKLGDSFARNLETLDETLHHTFAECCRQRLSKGSPNQEQNTIRKHDREHEHNRADARHEPKSGSDDERLSRDAREALSLNPPGTPIDILVDTLQNLRPGCKRSTALRLVNEALTEQGQAYA